MKPWTAVRWTGAFWFVPVLFAVTCLVGSSDMVRIGYPTADIAGTSYGMVLAGPISAGFVAARFRRFPRFSRTLRSPRSGLAAVVIAWWPLLLGIPLVVCLAVISSARAIPAEWSGWSLLIVDFLTMAASVLLGLAFAWALPVVVAVPAVTVGLFLWLAYTPSTTSELLHNVGATFSACCGSSTRPATVAVTGAVVVAGAVCAGVAAMLIPSQWARWSRLLLTPLIVVLVGASFGAATAAVRNSSSPLTLQAVQSRTTTLTCHDDLGFTVCLWPENGGRVDEIAAIVKDLNTHLGALGLPAVTSVSQAGRDRNAISVQAGDQLTHDDLRYTVAAGYVDQQSGCLGAVGSARDVLVAFVALAAGLGPDSLPDRFSRDVVAEAGRQVARARADPAAGRTWFSTGMGRLVCGTAR